MTIAAPQPFDMAENIFLCGDSGKALDIDKIFAKTLEHVLDDIKDPDSGQIEINTGSKPFASLIDSRFSYQETPIGILALYEGEIVGGYMSCDLTLKPEYQGIGIGAELVIERCLLDGQNPVWHLDTPAYTPAGVAAHRAAWRRVRGFPSETAKRMKRF